MRRVALLFVPFLFACSLVETPRVPTDVPSPAFDMSTSKPPTLAPASPPASMEPSPPIAFPDPSRYTWRGVMDGLQSPVGLQNAGDSRLFLVEQPGVIRIFDETGLRDEPFLDLQDRVGDAGNEQGLLGLAFSPDYASDHTFYVNYTNNRGDTVISRFFGSDDASRADPSSERVLLVIDQPYPNHNGGNLAFGPEGDLYIGTGDGGSAGDPQERAQNLDSLLGKILRLDIRGGDPYLIPSDNPFASGGGRPEIWAYGLRNPWRFSFDPSTGDLYIADVGQDQWEEVDVLRAGSPGGTNFGWNLREGLAFYKGDASPTFTDPVAVYAHDSGGCSVTGGEVVRDPGLPEWNGVYLYGDFCTGRIWGLYRDSGGSWQNQLLFDTGFQITSFGKDAVGGVYVLDRSGSVYRLSPAG